MKPRYLLPFLAILFALSLPLPAAILIRIPNVPGDSRISGYKDWIDLESLGFGVDRTTVATKPGAILGIGELQEIAAAKFFDRSSARLFLLAITGQKLPGPAVEIHFVESSVGSQPQTIAYLVMKLEGVAVKSMGTSGNADDRPADDVAFVFDKIAFVYFPADQNGVPSAPGVSMDWDRLKNSRWTDPGPGLPTSPPISK